MVVFVLFTVYFFETRAKAVTTQTKVVYDYSAPRSFVLVVLSLKRVFACTCFRFGLKVMELRAPNGAQLPELNKLHRTLVFTRCR